MAPSGEEHQGESIMNPEVKQKWMTALCSGKYQQTTLRLKKETMNGEEFCCLGVLCDLYNKETGKGKWVKHLHCNDYGFLVDEDLGNNWAEWTQLPGVVAEWAGIDTVNCSFPSYKPADMCEYGTLINENDHGKNFHEIANVIREKF